MLFGARYLFDMRYLAPVLNIKAVREAWPPLFLYTHYNVSHAETLDPE